MEGPRSAHDYNSTTLILYKTRHIFLVRSQLLVCLTNLVKENMNTWTIKSKLIDPLRVYFHRVCVLYYISLYFSMYDWSSL
jgi:hypothetical protein